MVKIKTASQDYLPIPVAVTKASRLKHGRTLKLMTAHGLKIRVKVAEAHKAAKALINNQSSSAPSFSTKSTAPRHPSFTNVEANTKRIVKDMCCYNKRMKLSSEVKNYVRDIAQFLDYSSKFYIVTMKNIHEVRQGGKIFHLQSIYSLEK
uniref:Uncharacterized protein n=1 Tax=Oryza nivara TaxID=4536 RepID=A0A0E0HYF2_ORYNI